MEGREHSPKIYGGEDILRDIERILNVLRRRKVRIAGAGLVDLVDREREARTILEGAAEIRGQMSSGFIVIYGPMGCGKSTLFESLLESIEEANRAGDTLFEAIHVGYEEREEARRIVRAMGSGNMLRNIADALKELDPSIMIEGRAAISASLSISGLVWKIVQAIERSRNAKEKGRILIVMDEVRVRKREIDRFTSWLNSFANDLRRADQAYYERKGGHITVIALTSDALAARAWYSVGEKVEWALMWNLPREAFERLADQLRIKEDRDLLWRLAGGNPRALERIRAYGLETWLRGAIDRVVKVLRTLDTRRDSLFEALGRVADDPDNLGLYGHRELPLAGRFLRFNIAIEIVGLPGPMVELPREPWVGGEYAFQIPAYYYAVRSIASKRSLDVLPGDVVAEARGS